MRQDVDETRKVSLLELWRRAQMHGDLQAWAAFQHNLEETVLTWFHDHPGREAACRMHNERHSVAQAFGQFQQVVVQGLVDCETLSEVVLALRASLNGVIMMALRISSRPQAESSHGSAGRARSARQSGKPGNVERGPSQALQRT
jgi:hypothetical protein